MAQGGRKGGKGYQRKEQNFSKLRLLSFWESEWDWTDWLKKIPEPHICSSRHRKLRWINCFHEFTKTKMVLARNIWSLCILAQGVTSLPCLSRVKGKGAEEHSSNGIPEKWQSLSFLPCAILFYERWDVAQTWLSKVRFNSSSNSGPCAHHWPKCFLDIISHHTQNHTPKQL